MAPPTVETAIWLALKERVKTIPLSPLPPIHWPNEIYEPKVGTAYLKVEHIPNTTQRVFIGSMEPHRYRGILQIGLMTKLNQQVGIALEMAGGIASHFPPDLRLVAHDVTVRVTRRPDMGPAQPQSTHLMIPVSVEYETWA